MNLLKKTIILSTLFTTISISLSAQNGAIVNAIFYQRDSNFVQAKEEIDKACVHEKTQTSTKAWYTKGEVYEGISLSKKPEIIALDTNSIFTAFDAYNKSISFDKPNGSYSKQAKERLVNVWIILINTGITNYQNKQYDKALKYFTTATEIKPNDTTAYIYKSYAAEAKQDLPLLNATYEQLLKLNCKSKNMFHVLNRYASENEKNYEKALSIIRQARQIYPNEITFITDEFNVYLLQGNKELAKKKLLEAIEKDPKNSLLYFNLGVLNEQEGTKDKAIDAYNVAIELNPNNTDALFNLGAIYYHEASDIFMTTNKMTLTEYKMKGKDLEDNALEIFKKSLPNFEKVYSINKDAQTKRILYDIYNKLKMKDKADELIK